MTPTMIHRLTSTDRNLTTSIIKQVLLWVYEGGKLVDWTTATLQG